MKPAHLATAAGELGSASAVRSWQVRSSAPAGAAQVESGEVISRPDYAADNWYVAPPRSTVMAALLANGVFENIEYSTNLRDLVDPTLFTVPWWYRTTFEGGDGGRTSLRIDGIVHKADLFVNGHEVAGKDEIAGAYVVSSFDVSGLVRRGLNALAIRVHPGTPLEDLSISWVDWNQWPPDHNLGVWRDVVVERTGDVSLGTPNVIADLPLPGLAPAKLHISVEATNLSPEEVDCEVEVSMLGPGLSASTINKVHLAAGERRSVVFRPEDSPALRVADPAIWWPVGEGGQPRYDLTAIATVDGELSDRRSIRFGIRTVRSHIENGGGRRFVVNGRPLQLIGGGWSPDLFLRHDPARIAAELSYVIDLGHNCVRLEGKLENAEFFEKTDELGVMVLPGWECCSKWEAEKGPKGSPWSEQDYLIAERSMESEARLLRHHPSVIGFFIGSDFAPTERQAESYVAAARRAGWSTPLISAATVEGTAAAGPSGMKMTGPYAWVPPVYWYSEDPRFGGAVGFNSETAAGSNIPRLSHLEAMLSRSELEALWREPAAKQFHAGPPSVFDNLAIFHGALAARYGRVTSLADFARKAQLANYEATRAQFEAFLSHAFAARPATGLIYWMLNSAWPSLNWQLYDWYLDPAGAYFGAKKATSRRHVFYDYGSGSVGVWNHTRSRPGPWQVEATVVSLEGQVKEVQRHNVSPLDPYKTRHVGNPTPAAGPTYLLCLRLSDERGRLLERNDYWLSTLPDELDWEKTSWQYTPTRRFADLTALSQLPEASLDCQASLRRGDDGRAALQLTLRNSGTPPALGVHAAVAWDGAPRPFPVQWSDNDVLLLAGEERSLEGRFSLPEGPPPSLVIEGFNLAAMRRQLSSD